MGDDLPKVAKAAKDSESSSYRSDDTGSDDSSVGTTELNEFVCAEVPSSGDDSGGGPEPPEPPELPGPALAPAPPPPPALPPPPAPAPMVMAPHARGPKVGRGGAGGEPWGPIFSLYTVSVCGCRMMLRCCNQSHPPSVGQCPTTRCSKQITTSLPDDTRRILKWWALQGLDKGTKQEHQSDIPLPRTADGLPSEEELDAECILRTSAMLPLRT